MGLIHPTAIATPSIAPIMCTLGPAIGTERTSEIRACVPVALNHPMVIVISRTVLVPHIAILAMYTRSTSVVPAVVVDLEHAVTATTPHALVTHTSVSAIGIDY